MLIPNYILFEIIVKRSTPCPVLPAWSEASAQTVLSGWPGEQCLLCGAALHAGRREAGGRPAADAGSVLGDFDETREAFWRA